MSPGAHEPEDGARVSGGERKGLRADERIDEVKVSIVGLHGPAYIAAHRAALAARSSPTLGSLDATLRGKAAADLAAAAAAVGSEVAIDVAPGPRRGSVKVSFRATPPLSDASVATAHTGIGEDMGAALSFRATHVASITQGAAPMHIGLVGSANFAQERASGTLRLTPPMLLPSGWSPTVELGESVGLAGPTQTSTFGALAAEDPTGKHSVKLGVTVRELMPGDGASDAVCRLPQQSTKVGVMYRYVEDTRQPPGGAATNGVAQMAPGEVRAATLEASGPLGDVSQLRAQTAYLRSMRVFGSGLLSMSATAALTAPLGGGPVPFEDRFSLGGTSGQGIGERLPGFAAHGAEPCDARRAADGGSPGAGNRLRQAAEQLRTVWRFDRRWQVERGTEVVPEPAIADERTPEGQKVDWLGANARATAAVGLQWPLPALGALQFHSFVRCTAATIIGEVRPSMVLQDAMDQTRVSVSMGVAAPLPGGALVGLSLAQPLLAGRGDRLERLQAWLSFGSLF